MKSKNVLLIIFLNFILSFTYNTTAQNWFPLEVGNKWEYIVNTDYQGLPENAYYLREIVVISDTMINFNTYYKISDDYYSTNYQLCRYDSLSNSLFSFYDGTERLEMDFNLAAGDTVSDLFYRIVFGGYDSLFQDQIEYKGWYDSIPNGLDVISIQKRYCNNKGFYYEHMVGRVPGTDWYDRYTTLIQTSVKIDDSVVISSHNYYPKIVFQPDTIISDSIFSITASVDHYFTRDQIPPPGSDAKLFNFIDTVLVESFYSNGDSVIYNSALGMENTSNEKSYKFNNKINLNLLRSGFYYYYRIKAIDKSMYPHVSFSPDTGYYIAVYDTVTGIIDVDEPPTSFKLYQNYPNPFNPTTNILYSITDKQFVAIKIFNVLGNEISTLVNEEKPAGEYNFEFDAFNLPSGIYFYQLNAGNFIQTKKMILLR